ncbi:MAG: hypothetical protein K2H60_05005 [Muribaculaceae bacterium]|nr:hypothetical protein [Muribaculaceae bacterium]
MVTFSKYLLILLTLMLSFTYDSYGKKETAKEIIIFPEQDYATTLNAPVAAMVLEYHSPNLIEEELIFEEGKTTPAIRIIKKGIAHDIFS